MSAKNREILIFFHFLLYFSPRACRNRSAHVVFVSQLLLPYFFSSLVHPECLSLILMSFLPYCVLLKQHIRLLHVLLPSRKKTMEGIRSVMITLKKIEKRDFLCLPICYSYNPLKKISISVRLEI